MFDKDLALRGAGIGYHIESVCLSPECTAKVLSKVAGTNSHIKLQELDNVKVLGDS